MAFEDEDEQTGFLTGTIGTFSKDEVGRIAADETRSDFRAGD